MGAFLLCLAPWAARNWAVHHRFVLVSTNGGFNFWVGNNPLATGEACDATGEPVWTRIPEPLKQELAAQSEVQQDQFLYREGLRFIHDEPGRFLTLTARRLLYFWWFRPGAGSGQSPYPPHWVLAYQLVYGVVLVAAGVGVWAARAVWRQLWPIYVLFVSLTAVYSVFFVHTRYRMTSSPSCWCWLRMGWRSSGVGSGPI